MISTLDLVQASTLTGMSSTMNESLCKTWKELIALFVCSVYSGIGSGGSMLIGNITLIKHYYPVFVVMFVHVYSSGLMIILAQ